MTAGPSIVDPLPEGVKILDPVWITMSDGCRLAARLWLPTSARTTRRASAPIFELVDTFRVRNNAPLLFCQ
jgi:predicted acyl esterase